MAIDKSAGERLDTHGWRACDPLAAAFKLVDDPDCVFHLAIPNLP